MINTVFDIGENFLKTGELTLNRNYIEPRILSFSTFEKNVYDYEFPDENFNFDGVIAVKEKKKINFSTREIHIIIPDSRTYFQIIETPLLTEKELISAIKYHSEQFIPIPFDQVAIDMNIIYTDKFKKKLKNLIVASPKLIINKIAKIAENSNFVPLSIENETSALIRLVQYLVNQKKLQGNNQNNYLFFINLGFKSTSGFLFNIEKNIPEEIVSFSTGIEIFTKEISLNFNNTLIDAVELLKKINFSDNNNLKIKSFLDYSFNFYLTEISNILNSLQKKYSINLNEIYYYGEGSIFNFIIQKLQQSLNINLKIINLDLFLKLNNKISIQKQDQILFYPLFGSIL